MGTSHPRLLRLAEEILRRSDRDDFGLFQIKDDSPELRRYIFDRGRPAIIADLKARDINWDLVAISTSSLFLTEIQAGMAFQALVPEYIRQFRTLQGDAAAVASMDKLLKKEGKKHGNLKEG